MYYRFLNNKDYLGVMSQKAFDQTVRDKNVELLCADAESKAETLMRDYLTEHYDIDYEFNIGKYIAGYVPDINITYPSGAHLYINGDIYQTLQAINGAKKPLNKEYWKPITEDLPNFINKTTYSQMETYKVGDIVAVGEDFYECIHPNGFELYDIRMPHFEGWSIVKNVDLWKFNDYQLSDVVMLINDDLNYDYYILIKEDKDKTLSPDKNDSWERIEEYSQESVYDIGYCAVYKSLEGKEVVVRAFTNVNRDSVEIGKNVMLHDPRNETIKNYMLKLSVYELSKQNSANHNSAVRVKDYDDTILWLNRASTLRITPAIKRKKDYLGEDTVTWETAQIINTRDGGIIKTGWSAF